MQYKTSREKESECGSLKDKKYIKDWESSVK